MWGHVIAEVNVQRNFNLSFTNMQSEVLIHLTQWQYWWWFWFFFLWSFYYLIVLRITRVRVLRANPRVSTSLRPHGKWGDLIICVIPVGWCINIITNSNEILKMIEWQNETGLFTLRVRGKQWYWVYKYEIKTLTDIFTLPKNVGHDKWRITAPNEILISDDYLHALQLRINSEWVKEYWNENRLDDEVSKFEDFNIKNSNKFIYKNKEYLLHSSKKYSDYVDINRWNRREFGLKSPLRFIKFPLSNRHMPDIDADIIELFRIKFNNNNVKLEEKTHPETYYFVFKQKRYLRKKYIKPYIKGSHTLPFGKRNNSLTKRNYFQYLSSDNILLKTNFNEILMYKNFKNNKNRNELSNQIFNKRLLRVTRTVVLPAHVNLTAITNSFDVVHSWFIPGLGLKMDCIPGRSTHHTFYIDNVGFYYGQCAEICGRYHHHMPIRICALPYEHFLVWWNYYGVKRFMRGKSYFKKHRLHIGTRKYVW